MNKNYSCLDGSMEENFIIPSASQDVTAREFNEPLYAANGLSTGFGLIDRNKQQARQEARQGRRQARFETRMGAKTARNQAKLTTAEGLKEAAKDDGTAQAIATLGNPASASASSTAPKSNTMYYVIGGVVLLGIAYYFMKGKGKN